MKRSWGIVATMAWLLTAPFDALASEESGDDEELPDPVGRALRGVVGERRVLAARRVGEAWHVTVLVDDHREDLAFSDEGQWLGRSRRVRRDAIPTEVSRTLDHRYDRYALWRIDLHQYPVGDVYVVHASHGSQVVEACVSADGEVLGERLLEESA